MHFEPEEERVVRDLRPLLDHLSRITESAFDEVVTYYKQKKRPVNIQALPDRIRDEAKYLLEMHPLQAQPYVLEDLARNGISLLCHGQYYQGYHIKILKYDHDTLPVARISERKEQFLGQKVHQLPLAFALLETPHHPVQPPFLHLLDSASRLVLNLVFGWEADFQQGMLRLALVCPERVVKNRAVIYWKHNIEHAALRIAKEQPEPISVDGLDDPDEFGISLPSLGEFGNGQEDG